MDLGVDNSVDCAELRERLFAGATLASCLFAFVSCFSLIIVVPMLSENAISLSERMYESARQCNESIEELRTRMDSWHLINKKYNAIDNRQNHSLCSVRSTTISSLCLLVNICSVSAKMHLYDWTKRTTRTFGKPWKKWRQWTARTTWKARYIDLSTTT
ncbi:hypothetical protein M3Y94_01296900 [Aphelenchoides besseyi]|nr:hypothetical protein M3Y94_01296900 [Aphelenchoides besseyi]